MTDSVTNITKELKTIRDWARWGASQFMAAKLYYGHGTDNAWDEAVYLTLHAVNLPPQSSSEVFDGRLTMAERENVYDLLMQRVTTKKPAPYLTHEAWFAGMPFFVDERVLIPRSPMIEIIERHFSPWLSSSKVHNILDLCTGSGCLAIACAQAFPKAKVMATDISQDALDVAAINIQKYELNSQIKLIKSDLYQNIPNQKFDIIISNPPYVDAEDMASLPDEYRHEPEIALAAGQDGLKLVKAILINANKYLSDHGVLLIEVGNSEKALIKQFPDISFTWLTLERGGDGVFILTKEKVAGMDFAKQN